MRPFASAVAAVLLTVLLPAAFGLEVIATTQKYTPAIAKPAESFQSPGVHNLVQSAPASQAPVPSAQEEEEPLSSLSESGRDVISMDGIRREITPACKAATERLKSSVARYASENRRGRDYDEAQVAALVMSLVYTEDDCKMQGVGGYLNLGCGIYESGFTKTVASQLNCATNTLYNWLERRQCSGNVVCALQKYSPETRLAGGRYENRPGLYNERLGLARSVLDQRLLA